MSLGIAFKGPEGLVLTADSRVTLGAAVGGGPQIISYFDNATKLLSLNCQTYLGIITYGTGAIGLQEPRTAHSFLPELEAVLEAKFSARASVIDIAREVGAFYSEQWRLREMPDSGTENLMPMSFLVAGFNEGDAYGKVYEVAVPTALEPVEKAANEFGVTFGGQAELAARLLGGVDPRALQVAALQLSLTPDQVQDLAQNWARELNLPIPYQFLPLQDCVDLSTFLVYMTTAVQSWTLGVRGVGGAVDVATITRTDGFRPVKQKTIQPWE